MNSSFHRTEDKIATLVLCNQARYVVPEVICLQTTGWTHCSQSLQAWKLLYWNKRILWSTVLHTPCESMVLLYGDWKNVWHPFQPVANGTCSVTTQLSSRFIQEAALVYAHNRNSIALKTTLKYIDIVVWDFGIRICPRNTCSGLLSFLAFSSLSTKRFY
jgi:hypothetical protein